MLTEEVARLARGNESGAVPPWSGRVVPIGERYGVMVISNSDTTTHVPPPGWEFISDEPEVCHEYDAEAWFLERVW